MFLFHHQLHAGPPMLSLPSEHVDGESKPALIGTHLGIEDAFHVLHPLVRLVGTLLAIKLGRLMLQEILQTPLWGVEVGDEDRTPEHQQHSPLTDGEHPHAASEHPLQPA